MVVSVAQIASQRASFESLVRAFDAGSLVPYECERVLEHATAMKHMAATLEALAAARAAEPAEQLAVRTGTTANKAGDAMRTAERLHSQPVVDEAARAGLLSPEQAAVISDAAAANPTQERRLVELAATRPLKSLREECDRVKAAADPDAEATHERVHRERSLRIWTDAGVAKMFGRCTPEQMAVIRAAVEAKVDELFKAARANGKHEPRDAYAMDALHEICAERLGQPDAPAQIKKKKAPTYLGLVRVDLEALRRGQVEGDELCEIVGLGPVPVRVARKLLGDAVLHVILTKGSAVGTTVNIRRGPSVAQRMALLWASPKCAVTVCNRTRVEIDHDVPWAACRTTELRNLRPLCGHCHGLKTNHGYRVVEQDGIVEIVPP